MNGASSDGSRNAFLYIAERLPDLLKAVQDSDLLELEIQDGEARVRLNRAPRTEPAADGAAELPAPVPDMEIAPTGRITSPLVGVFHPAAGPDGGPAFRVGTRVSEDTVVGIVEALGFPTDVEALCSGTVSEILVSDGQPVQYGQVLYEITPDV